MIARYREVAIFRYLPLAPRTQPLYGRKERWQCIFEIGGLLSELKFKEGITQLPLTMEPSVREVKVERRDDGFIRHVLKRELTVSARLRQS